MKGEPNPSPPPWQEFGVGSAPKKHALEQSSGSVEQKGVPPVEAQSPVPVGAQDMMASQPSKVIDPSDVKTNVRHPFVEATVPGEVPENVPINGSDVVGPS